MRKRFPLCDDDDDDDHARNKLLGQVLLMLISVEVEKKGGRQLVGGKLYEEVAGLFVANMKHSLQTVCFFFIFFFKLRQMS